VESRARTALDLGHHALDDRRREPALEDRRTRSAPGNVFFHVVEVEAGERAL